MLTDRSIHPARRWLVLWIGYWIFAFVLTHLPPGAFGGSSIPGADKVIHFCLYFVLTWLCERVIRARRGRLDVRPMLIWAVVFMGYGATDEWLQAFVNRTPSVADWFADVAGIVAALGWNLLRHGSRHPAKGSSVPLV